MECASYQCLSHPCDLLSGKLIRDIEEHWACTTRCRVFLTPRAVPLVGGRRQGCPSCNPEIVSGEGVSPMTEFELTLIRSKICLGIDFLVQKPVCYPLLCTGTSAAGKYDDSIARRETWNLYSWQRSASAPKNGVSRDRHPEK